MGPISSYFVFPEWLNMLTAFLIGTGFGFALEQGGFSSSRKLAGMFYGYDATVLKVFFTAAIVAMIGSQLMSYLGLLNLNQVYINEFYVTRKFYICMINTFFLSLRDQCSKIKTAFQFFDKIIRLFIFFGFHIL